MSEEIDAMQEELTLLREEVAALRSRRTLELRDPGGAVRLRLAVDNERASICFYDQDAGCRMSLELGEKGPRVELRGPGGEDVVTLKVIDGHGQVSAAAPD